MKWKSQANENSGRSTRLAPLVKLFDEAVGNFQHLKSTRITITQYRVRLSCFKERNNDTAQGPKCMSHAPFWHSHEIV